MSPLGVRLLRSERRMYRARRRPQPRLTYPAWFHPGASLGYRAMPDRGSPASSRFSATFPRRFAAALADAQGAIAGIAASAHPGGSGLIGADGLRRLHEIYRLRVELEIETAGVLWRTAEVVAALADVLDVLGRRGDPAPDEAIPFLGSLASGEVEGNRTGLSGPEEAAARRASWPHFAGAAVAQTAPEAEVLKFPSPPPMHLADAARAA